MRGKHCNVEIAVKLRRITPCWKSIVAHIVRCVNKDRSPRVRGKLHCKTHSRQTRRITPARAGKTSRLEHDSGGGGDHPRACGENRTCLWLRGLPDGSPPRVRGKQNKSCQKVATIRITPARAGKTCGARHERGWSEDHPRACGENSAQAISCSAVTGSPPRVRGKPYSCTRTAGITRITPARAGKTPASAPARPSSPDHPRACGENTQT